MAYIEWTDDFSVNVKEIDEQHKQLIAMINTLHEAFLANKAKEVHNKIVQGMVDYARIHFQTEEKYMMIYEYPGYKEHHEEHERFAEKALQLQNQLRSSGFVLSQTILDFLKSWIHDHILGTDKKYTQFFNRHGIR